MVAERLGRRLAIGRVWIVEDRGAIGRATLAELEQRRWLYIVGARLHTKAPAGGEALPRLARYEIVHPAGATAKDVSPLKVQWVMVGDQRRC